MPVLKLREASHLSAEAEDNTGTEAKTKAKAVVDATLCVGCGVCTQLCKFGAFGEVQG